MKAKILIIIFLSTFSLIGKAQNLIANPSFENIDLFQSIVPLPFPSAVSMLVHSQDWTSLSSIQIAPCGSSPLVWGGSTPDLFKVGASTIHFVTTITGLAVNGNSGNFYAGMGPSEIIQQKLSRCLLPGRYKLKLFIRGTSGDGLTNANLQNCFFSLGTEVSGIKVFASNSKIEYTNWPSSEKKNGLQPIKFISASSVANFEWTEISTEFFIEDENIQWIGIEGSDIISYTLIDDISLEISPCNTCTDACNPESGCIEAGIAYTNTCDLEVVKLGNASSLDMTIINENGVVERSIHIDHPPCRVKFDGRNQTGVDLAPGLYTLIVKVKNGCEVVKILPKKFLKTGAWTGADCSVDPINYNSLTTTSKINPKLVCCPTNLAIGVNTQITDIATTVGGMIKCLAIGEYLQQQPVFSLPPLKIKAKQAIVIDPGISNMKNITFTAPKITINGSTAKPQSIYDKATFINGMDCPFGLVADNGNTTVSYLKSSNAENSNSNVIAINGNLSKTDRQADNDFDFNTDIKLSPNPNNGKFQIDIPNSLKLSDFDIIIVDFLGVKINTIQKLKSHSQTIDLSMYADGMYLIKINKNNIPFWVSKMLKTTN